MWKTRRWKPRKTIRVVNPICKFPQCLVIEKRSPYKCGCQVNIDIRRSQKWKLPRSVAKTDELKQHSAVDMVDQPFDHRPSPPQAALPRVNGSAKLAFDRRVDRFGIPTLSKQPSKCARETQSARLSFRVQLPTESSRRWDQMVVAAGLTVETRASQHNLGFPLALVMSIAASCGRVKSWRFLGANSVAALIGSSDRQGEPIERKGFLEFWKSIFTAFIHRLQHSNSGI